MNEISLCSSVGTTVTPILGVDVTSNILVAIVDPDRQRRHTLGAVLYVELGLEPIIASSLEELIAELAGRSPNLIIVGGRRLSRKSTGWLGEISDRYPYVPLIVVGGSAPRGHAPLPVPVDAVKLVNLVLELLAE